MKAGMEKGEIKGSEAKLKLRIRIAECIINRLQRMVLVS